MTCTLQACVRRVQAHCIQASTSGAGRRGSLDPRASAPPRPCPGERGSPKLCGCAGPQEKLRTKPLNMSQLPRGQHALEWNTTVECASHRSALLITGTCAHTPLAHNVLRQTSQGRATACVSLLSAREQWWWFLTWTRTRDAQRPKHRQQAPQQGAFLYVDVSGMRRAAC